MPDEMTELNVELREHEEEREDKIVRDIMKGKVSFKEFMYRLLFTKEDSLDLTQIVFLVNVFYFFIAFGLAGTGVWKVTVAAWSVFGSIFATLAIAGTATNVATLIANSKVPGEVAQGIAQSEAEPNMWLDDERGGYTEREEVPVSKFKSSKEK